jgi:hypothetical protein
MTLYHGVSTEKWLALDNELEKRAEGKGRGLLKSLSWHFPSYY